MVLAEQSTNGHANGAGDTYGALKQMNFAGVVENAPPAATGKGDNDSYSAFVHFQSEIMKTLYGVVMQGNITNELEMKLILRLFESFGRHFNAEACNTSGLIKVAEDSAREFRKEIKDIGPVEELVNEWSRAANILAEALVAKRTRGLRHVRSTFIREETFERELEDGTTQTITRVVETARDLLDQARAAKESTRRKAAELPHAANQYFRCKIHALQLSIDRDVAEACGIVTEDFTAVKAKLGAGTSIHLVIGELPWEYKEIYSRVFASMADGDKMRDYLTTNQIQQWPYDRRPPKPKRGLLGLTSKDDDDEDEDYDDRPADRRRKDRDKDRDRKKKGGR